MKSNTSFSRIRGKTPDSIIIHSTTSPPAKLSTSFHPSYPLTSARSKTPKGIGLASLYTPGNHVDQMPLFRLSHSRDTANLDTRYTEHSSRIHTLESERRTNATLLAEIQKLEALLKNNRQSDGQWKQQKEELESRIKVLVDENERLRDLIDQYANENENLKNVIQGLAHDPEIFTSLNEQNKELQYEVERLNEALALRLKEISTLQSKASLDVGPLSARKSARQSVRPRESLRRVNNENRMMEFNEQRKELEEVEHKALNAINKQTKDLQSWQVAYKKLEAKLNAVLLENEKLKETQNPNSQELLLLRTQFIEMQDRLKDKKDIETRLQLTLLECDALKGKVEELSGEREIQHRRIIEFESQNPDREALEDRIILLIEENKRLNKSLIENKYREEQILVFEGKEFENERRMLMLRIEELEEIVKSTWDLKDKVVSLADENDRLRILEQEKDAHVELLTKNLIESQEECENLTEIKDKIGLLVAENKTMGKLAAMKESESNEWRSQHLEMEQINIRLDLDLQQSREEILELRHNLRTVSEQLEKMNLLVREKEHIVKEGETFRLELNTILVEKENLEEKVELFMAENIRINSLLQEKTQEIELLKKDCSNFQAEITVLKQRYESLQSEKNEIEGKIELLISENMHVNSNTFDKMKQLEEWQSKYFSMEAENTRLANVIFEFDRISQENEHMKKLLADSQGYESQIRILNLENERLITVTAENFEKLEELQAKCQKLEAENHALGGLENDMVDKLRILEDKIKMLVNDNINLGSVISEKSMQYDELKMRFSTLEIESLHFKQREEGRAGEKEQLREEIRLLEIDRTKLSNTLIEMVKQVEIWENKYYQSEAKVESLKGLERDYLHLQDEADRFKKASYEKPAEVNSLKEIIRTQNIKLGALPELESKLILLATENERLETELKEIIHQHEEAKWKNNRIAIQPVEIEELRDRIRLLAAENQRIQSALRDADHRLEEARQKDSGVQIYQLEIEDLRRKLDEANMEKARQQNNMKELTYQIDELKNRNIRLETHHFEFTSSPEPKGEELKRRTVQQRDSDFGSPAESKITLLAAENERLKTQLTVISQDLDQARWKSNNNRDQLHEVEELKIRVNSLTKENEELKYRLRSITQDFDDLKWKNSEIGSVQVEVEELRRRIEIITTEKEHLHRSLDDMHQHKEDWMSKYFSLQEENKELHLQVGSMKHENIHLTSTNTQLINELQEMRSTLVQLEENRVKTELIEREVDSILKDNEYLHRELEAKIQEIEQNRQHINELILKEGEAIEFKSRVQSLREDNERLDRQVMSLREEIYIWKERFEGAQKSQPNLVELDRRIDALGNENLRINRELADKTVRIAELEKKDIELASLKNQENWKNSENQLLNKTVIDLKEELRVWKEKGALFDKNQPLIGELERKLEQLIRENKRLSQELLEKAHYTANTRDNEIVMQDMKNQIQRLILEKEQFERLVVELRQEIIKMQGKHTHPISPVQEIYEPQTDVETRLGLLLKENKRLVQVVDDNNQYIQSLNQELEVRQSPVKSSPERTTIIRTSEPAQGKFGTTGNITYKIEGESDEDEEAESGQEFDVDALDEEDKIGLLVEEIEKLQRKLDKKNKLIEIFRLQAGNVEANNQQMYSLLQENEHLRLLIEGQKAKQEGLYGSPLRQETIQTNEIIHLLQAKIVLLTAEIERLSTELDEKKRK